MNYKHWVLPTWSQKYMTWIFIICVFFIPLFLSFACSRSNQQKKLPILGPFERIDGQKRYHAVPDFELFNQTGDTITATTFENKLRIVDFFFISCPTICPKVQAEMLRIYEAFPNDDLQFISHSIDTRRDTIERLASYAEKLGIQNSQRWHFVTGTKETIFNLADDYFNIVVEDPSAPGGLDHSGRIVLVDKEGYIRAFANGLQPESVDLLIGNIGQLLKSYQSDTTK